MPVPGSQSGDGHGTPHVKIGILLLLNIVRRFSSKPLIPLDMLISA